MNKRSKVLFLIILSGLMGLCSCSQYGANEEISGEGARNSSDASPSSPASLLQEDEVNRILALDGKSVEDVVETLGDIQASHPALDSKSLASQFDQVVSIRCDGNRCEIAQIGQIAESAKKGGI